MARDLQQVGRDQLVNGGTQLVLAQVPARHDLLSRDPGIAGQDEVQSDAIYPEDAAEAIAGLDGLVNREARLSPSPVLGVVENPRLARFTLLHRKLADVR